MFGLNYGWFETILTLNMPDVTHGWFKKCFKTKTVWKICTDL